MTTEDAKDRIDERRQMRNVDHTPPNGDGAHPVWERGGERNPEDDAAEGDAKRTEAADE